MKKNGRFILWALLTSALAAPVALGQEAQKKYVGEVIPDTVNIRSGPGTDKYVCTTLSKGDKVTVVNEYSGWLQIEPVAGCFSTVHKDYVKTTPGSDKGTITDTVFVRASGDKAGQVIRQHQGTLKPNDQVTILGSHNENYYRIAPPGQAFWWVKGTYVRRVEQTPAPAVTPRREDPEIVTPRVDPAERAGQPVRQDPMAEAKQKQWREVEQALAQEFQKPLQQRDYKALLARYEALDIGEDHYLHPWLQVRVDFLNRSIRQRQTLQEVEEMVRKSQAEQQRLKDQRTQLELAAMEQPAVSTYAVEGILMPSEVYTGKGGVPKRYLVYRPGTQRVIAFVQSTSQTVDLDAFTKKHVGIFGSRKFDSHLLLTLVDAMQVKVIDENPALPQVGRAKAIVPEPRTPAPEVPDAAPEDYESPRPDFGQSQEPDGGDQPTPQTPETQDESASDEEPAPTRNDPDESGDDLPAVEVEEVSDDQGEQAPEAGLPAAPAKDDPALNTVDEKEYK